MCCNACYFDLSQHISKKPHSKAENRKKTITFHLTNVEGGGYNIVNSSFLLPKNRERLRIPRVFGG